MAKYYIIVFLLEPVEPLHFSIHNSDINKHTVTVEIFDSDNKSLFKETYEANPEKYIYSPEITKKKGEYTFKVILDNKIEKTDKAEVGIGRLDVTIRLYEKILGEIIPIQIRQAIV